jgi:hypothetical protein
MPAIQFKQQSFGSSRFNTHRRSLGTSAAAKLIELGAALAAADSGASIPGFCFHCLAPGNAHNSTAQFPNVFCSEQCEQEFVRAALPSLTVEDCIRMHDRLETLLMGAKALAL